LARSPAAEDIAAGVRCVEVRGVLCGEAVMWSDAGVRWAVAARTPYVTAVFTHRRVMCDMLDLAAAACSRIRSEESGLPVMRQTAAGKMASPAQGMLGVGTMRHVRSGAPCCAATALLPKVPLAFTAHMGGPRTRHSFHCNN
jgi:hypothetical protein